MKKQYCVVKYVLAESAQEAEKKGRRIRPDEVYIHQAWLEKNKNHNMFEGRERKVGFGEK